MSKDGVANSAKFQLKNPPKWGEMDWLQHWLNDPNRDKNIIVAKNKRQQILDKVPMVEKTKFAHRQWDSALEEGLSTKTINQSNLNDLPSWARTHISDSCISNYNSSSSKDSPGFFGGIRKNVPAWMTEKEYDALPHRQWAKELSPSQSGPSLAVKSSTSSTKGRTGELSNSMKQAPSSSSVDRSPIPSSSNTSVQKIQRDQPLTSSCSQSSSVSSRNFINKIAHVISISGT